MKSCMCSGIATTCRYAGGSGPFGTEHTSRYRCRCAADSLILRTSSSMGSMTTSAGAMYGFLPRRTRAYAGTIDGRLAKEIRVELIRDVESGNGPVDDDIQCRLRRAVATENALGGAVEIATLCLRRARSRQACHNLDARDAR